VHNDNDNSHYGDYLSPGVPSSKGLLLGTGLPVLLLWLVLGGGAGCCWVGVGECVITAGEDAVMVAEGGSW
jgi:hypothetical protein